MRWLPLLLLTACGVGAARPAPPPIPTTTEPLATLPLERYRGKLRAVRAEVRGHAGLFLLDTGAGLSMITPDLARTIGCEPYGRLSGRTMFDQRIDVPECAGVDVRIAGFKLAPATVGVLDVTPLLDSGGAKLDGIIGLDGFADDAITLDLAHDRLVVESPASLTARVAGLREGKARIGHEVQTLATSVMVAVTTARGPLWFELDSGNGGKALVAQHAAEMVGLDPKKTGHEVQTAHLPVVALDPVEAEVMVGDMIIDGNLGAAFLETWTTTIDLDRGRVWFGVPPRPR